MRRGPDGIPWGAATTIGAVADITLRLFASARVAAGTGRAQMGAVTVADALDQARGRFGAGFAEVLAGCKVWLNGDPADLGQALVDGDEVAVLPPVSGG